jgi:HEAT repeat protein
MSLWFVLVPTGLVLFAGAVALTVWLLLPEDKAPAEPEKRTAAQRAAPVVHQAGPGPKAEGKSDPTAKTSPDLQARERSRKNLSELALAFHNHCDVHQRFPPAALAAPWSATNLPPPFDPRKGPPIPKTLLSWRVLILPYLGEERLFHEFKLNEPWDSPHNKKLLARMPAVYAPVRGKTPEPYQTYYQVFVGPETAFQLQAPPWRPEGAPPDLTFGGPNIARISDGTSNTLMIVEGGEPVPWTKPADLPYDGRKPLPKLGGLFPDGFHATFFDTEVFFIPRTLEEKTLRALITSMGGEVVYRDEVLPKPAKPPAKKEKPGTAPENAAHWLRRMSNPDAAARREAVQKLALLIKDQAKAKDRCDVPQILTALAQAMCDRDPEVAREAKKGLGLLDGPSQETVAGLLAAFPDDDGLLFNEFAKWFRRGGPEIVPGLLAALHHDDFAVRARAAYLLQPLAGQDQKIGQALEARRQRLNVALGVDRNSPEFLESVLTLLEALHEKYDHPNFGSGLRNHALLAVKQIGPLGRVAYSDLFWTTDLSAKLVAATMALAADGGRSESFGLAALADALADASPRLRAGLAPRVVPDLILRLQNPRGSRREGGGTVAARALGELGPAAQEAVPVLLRLLQDPHFFPAAARALGRIGAPARAAVPSLKRLLQEQKRLARENKAPRDPLGRVWQIRRAWQRNPYASVAVADALLRLDPSEKKLALAALRDALNLFNRPEIALVLLDHGVVDGKVFEALLPNPQGGFLQTPLPVEEVRRLKPQTQKALLAVGRPLLRSTDAVKRHAAACILAPLDPEACLPVLIEFLKQGGAKEITEAAKVLGNLGPKAKAAFPELRRRLEEPPKANVFFTPDPGEVIHALARIDPAGAVPVLWKVWRDPPKPSKKGLGRFDPDFVFGQPLAFWELTRLGPRGKALIPALIADLKLPGKDNLPMSWFSPALHEAAQILLAKIGPPALPALGELLKAPNATWQERVARTLGRMGAAARPAAPALVKLVSSHAAPVRRAATAALGRIAPREQDVVAAVTLALQKDEDPEVRREAARALGGADPEIVPVLTQALTDRDESVRLAAVGALGRLGPKAVAPLRSALQQKRVQVRRLAVLALGSLRPVAPRSIPPLLDAAHDPDKLVRRLAVALLGPPTNEMALALGWKTYPANRHVLPDPAAKEMDQAWPVLSRALADYDARVRWTAAFIVEEWGRQARETVPALGKALGTLSEEFLEKQKNTPQVANGGGIRRGPDAENPAVLRRVLFALAAMGSAARPVQPALVKLLDKSGNVGTVTDVELRADATLVLARLAPDPVSLFIKILKSSSPAARGTAADMLVQLGPKAVPSLVNLVHRGEVDVRKRAVFCLGQIAPPPAETVPALVGLLKDNNLAIRLEAIAALSALGPDARTAAEPLARIAGDKQNLAHEAAAQALERIAPKAPAGGEGAK